MEAIPERLEEGRSFPTGISCPDCSGVLEVHVLGSDMLRFRCRIGHIYGSRELLRGKEEEIERHLWSSIASAGELEVLIETFLRSIPRELDADGGRSRHESVRRLKESLKALTEANRSMATESRRGADE